MKQREEFCLWLEAKGIKKKIISDTNSRLNWIEEKLKQSEYPFKSYEEEYQKDKGEFVYSVFYKAGNNDSVKKYKIQICVGKYYLSAYKSATKKYFEYLKEIRREC